ncbi:MAG: hypothetical protein II748_00850 [Clostridia bacterium]|nr:hypothetical protein [Clostridia bacterium]
MRGKCFKIRWLPEENKILLTYIARHGSRERARIHNFDLMLEEWFGKSMQCIGARKDDETGHAVLSFIPSDRERVCPYCGSTIVKIQKHSFRSVYDLFEIDLDSRYFDQEGDDLLVARIEYENTTYKCLREGCGKCFKNDGLLPRSASGTSKSHFSKRFISFIVQYMNEIVTYEEPQNNNVKCETAAFFAKDFSMALNVPLSKSTVLSFMEKYKNIDEEELLLIEAEP